MLFPQQKEVTDSITSGDFLLEQGDSFAALNESEWTSLLEKSAACSVFQSFSWANSWWKAFRDDKKRLLILSVRQKGKLVALAPLFLQMECPGFSFPPSRAWSLRFVGEEHADYLNFLVDRAVPGALDFLLDALTCRVASWDRFYLPEIPEGSQLYSKLMVLSNQTTSGLTLLHRTPCPGITIPGKEPQVADLLHKQSLKRSLAKMSRSGTLQVLHLRRSDEILPLLPGFFRQHIDRWAVTGSPSLFLNPQNRAFYESLVKSLTRDGKLIFTVINFQSAAAAYHFGLVSGNSFVWYKPTFDITLFRISPGEVLLRELIQLALQSQFDEFDFTRGDEQFKHRFANHSDHNATFVWYRKPRELKRLQRKQRIKTQTKLIVQRLQGRKWAANCFNRLQAKRARTHSVFALTLWLLYDILRSALKSVYSDRRVLIFHSSPDPPPVVLPSGVEVKRADLRFLLDVPGFPDEPSRSLFLQAAFSRLKKDDECFVMLANGTMASYCWVAVKSPIPITEINEDFAFEATSVCLYDAFTFPDFRRRGLGSLLLKNLYRHYDGKVLRIYCDYSNERSLRLIQKACFVPDQTLGLRTFLGRTIRYHESHQGKAPENAQGSY
jgi:CelD/BcsL family acetyltransferase involved in cellulose biosynthesis/GNAT superfamily N-acetyltransferase